MNVKRETINKKPHLVTDYMYNDDNIGIDLTLLNNEKTLKTYTIPSMLISDDMQNFNFTENPINISANLIYDSDKVKAIMNITSPDNFLTVEENISDEIFAEDLINICLKEKRGIKNLPCYENAIQKVIDDLKETSLSNNYLIKENEMNYKCYVYSKNMELLGVANRLLLTNKGNYYILGEYIGKSLEKIADDRDKVIIDICINDDLTVQLTNINITEVTHTSVAYAKVDLSTAKIKRIDATYESINLNIPKQITLPKYNHNYNITDYFDNFTSMNGRSEIINFYKLNKPNMTPMININKYLIG